MKYIKCRLTAMRKFVSSNYDRNKKIFYLIFFVFLLSAIPVYKQGITCNDELQARLWGMKGFGEFYRHYTKVYITTGGGRALSAILNPIYMYLGFGSNGSGSFRIVQILSIFGDAAMFSVFLNKLFHKKGFAVACGLSVVVFLPVTFELTAPNAFNTFFNIPVALLFLSFILYINYLDDNKNWELGLSILLLFLTLLSYEAFIMFVPLYWGICIKKKERRDKKQLIIKCLYPTLAALLFLILYVITGIVFRSQYAGIRIRNVSFGDSLAIIVQLIKSSIPGYFFFSAKYRYLAHIYFGLTLENYIRIIFVCVFFGLTIYAVMKQCKDNISNTGIFWRTLGVGALCIVLPAIPLSLAESYQGRLNSYDVLAQPTSYFCYFATTFVCWWVIWQLVQKLQSMPFVALTAVILSLYLFPVQAMNDMFAEQQSKDFKRLLALESLYSTELSGNWGGAKLYSTDFFQTQNGLAIHDSYWNEFAEYKKCNFEIVNGVGTAYDNRIYFSDNQFSVCCGDKICVLTLSPQDGYGMCQYGEEDYGIILYCNPKEDNGLYEYYYELSDTGNLIPGNEEIFLSALRAAP